MTMRSVWRKAHGMTLLEVLVVVAIGASIIAGVVVILQGQNDDRRREAAIQRQSTDMTILVKAARQFAAVTAAGWPDGTRAEVALDGLVDAGLLPDDFGTDDGSGDLGVTPLGQRYWVFAIKDGDTYDDPTVEDGTVRSVVLDLGDPNAGRAANVGVTATPEGLRAFKESVALMTTSDERIPMGVLEAGGEVVRGIGRAFTKDVIDWIEDAPAQPAVVALVGFHDLDGNSDDGHRRQYAKKQVPTSSRMGMCA
jgi:prepilin-type N-terminal cleavage/methylation domain-containing protein